MPQDRTRDPLGNIEEACRRVLDRLRESAPERALHVGALDRVRPVAMAQEPLESLISFMIRRAIEASIPGGTIVIEAEHRDRIQIPLTEEFEPRRCVLLSVDDQGPPIEASEIAKAMWYGLARREPGDHLLAWIYYLVRGTGGRVSVVRSSGGGNRVSCYLPVVTES